MIPKRLHQIWLGDREMPADCLEFVARFRDLHPDWEVNLWTDALVETLELTCRPDFLAATELAMKADILRYELLYQFGGVYADVDVEPQKPFDPIVERRSNFAALEDGTYLGNAVLGSEALDPFFAKLLLALPDSVTLNWARPINERTGPMFLSRVWREHGGLGIVPGFWFYPYLHTERHRRGQAFPDSYAVHHWMATWQGAV